MELTINYIRESFIKYNELYFNNDLEMPKFRITHSKRTLGQLSIRKSYYDSDKVHTISISDYYNRNERQYDNTIIHEMIHLYISQNNIIDNGSHGRRFKAECARINKYGWDLSRTTNTSGWEVSSESKKREEKRLNNITFSVIVYKLKENDNNQFIFRVSKGNEKKYINHLNKVTNKVKLFQTNDTLFDAFPSCRTKIRGRKIDENDLNFAKYMI